MIDLSNVTNMTPDYVKEYMSNQIVYNCQLPSPEQIFKYVCNKYNNWLIWFIPILVSWYLFLPIIANLIWKIKIQKMTEKDKNIFVKVYKIIYDTGLHGIIFFGGIIWIYMAVQNGWFEWLDYKI